MELVFDIETDDLKATKVWCIVAQDSGSGQIYKFAPPQLESGLELLQKADTLVGHNIIGFDIPVIHKLLGVDLSHKTLIDTLVLSRLFNPRDVGIPFKIPQNRLYRIRRILQRNVRVLCS